VPPRLQPEIGPHHGHVIVAGPFLAVRELGCVLTEELHQVRLLRAAPGDGVDRPGRRQVLVHDRARGELEVMALTADRERDLHDAMHGAEVVLIRGDGRDVLAEGRVRVARSDETEEETDARRSERLYQCSAERKGGSAHSGRYTASPRTSQGGMHTNRTNRQRGDGALAPRERERRCRVKIRVTTSRP
jgi:hypothetical protein